MQDVPLWSVMIPVYNRTKYLSEALNSVIRAGYDRDKMQIEVVDDCSTESDVEAVVKGICPKGISFYRQPRRIGLAANWNACIERARGELVHILHDDDFVSPGYYKEIESLAAKQPEIGLYATRCFFVDRESIIFSVTPRVGELERAAKSATPFFYETPIQCPGVTIRRRSYRELGGFRADLQYVLDCEMWARVASNHGAIVSSNIEAFYRLSDENESSRLSETAESILDVCRLNEIFKRKYTEFSVEIGRARASRMAWEQYKKYTSLGNDIAAAANWSVWVQVTPLRYRLTRRFSNRAMPYIRNLAFGS
jgi:glycosyltransferase involved in cell wall biosynthesis